MNRKIMEKERLGAFMDAVIAIIMTILVLDLDEPKAISWAGLWALHAHFFAYALSFFWLGSMWVNNHFLYHHAQHVSQKTVWSAVLMLFFASLFPYVTNLMAENFHSSVMQCFYGIVILCITAANMHFYRRLYRDNPEMREAHNIRKRFFKWDIPIKILGLVLSATVFPEAVSVAVLITLCGLMIPQQLKV